MSQLSIAGTFLYAAAVPVETTVVYPLDRTEKKHTFMFPSKVQQLITKEDASAAMSFNVSMFVSKACISM